MLSLSFGGVAYFIFFLVICLEERHVASTSSQNQSGFERSQRFVANRPDWSQSSPQHHQDPSGLRQECAPGWLPVALGYILLVSTWLANCTLLGGILQTLTNPLVVPVAYYFVGSQSIAVLLHATLNLPPALVILLFGSEHMESYLGIFCLFSTYLDTLFCNLALLHAFCSGLDSYLRLCGPSIYLLTVKKRPAKWLKIGFPWLVAGLQSIGQLAVLDRNKVRLRGDCRQSPNSHFIRQFEATCVITDPNFLIMRTSIAYALPLIACLCLTGLQMKRLRHLRYFPPATLKSQFTIQKVEEPSKYHFAVSSPVISPRECTSLRRDVTTETLVVPVSSLGTDVRLPRSVTIDTLETCTSAGFTVATLNELKKPTDAIPNSVHDCPRHGLIALTYFPKCDDEIRQSPPSTSDGNRICRALPKNNLQPSIAVHKDDQFALRKMHSRRQSVKKHSYQLIPQNTKTEVSTWFHAYRGEQLAVAINMVSCIVAVGVWSPMILSSLAHGLCQAGDIISRHNRPQQSQIYYIPGLETQMQRYDPRNNHCFIQVTVARLADFRWWSYASTGLLLPIVLLLMDTGLRRSCWQSLGFEWTLKRRHLCQKGSSIPLKHRNVRDAAATVTIEASINEIWTEPRFARINSKMRK